MKKEILQTETVEFQSEPFKYLINQSFLINEKANSLFNWLKNGVEWHLHKDHFFEQYESNLLNENIPEDCSFLIDGHFKQQLKSYVENQFSVKLDDKIKIVAHKFVHGQGVGIHNDDPSDSGNETHRLILNLNPDFEDEYGGHLIFYNSKNETKINRIFRPLHNSAIGFEACKQSYHAVSNVHYKERYSVIFSFWQLKASSTISPKSFRNILPEDLQKQYEQLLVEEGVKFKFCFEFLSENELHLVEHSQRNLIEHLFKTFLILKSWNCSEDTKYAGLFHSIYGTENFSFTSTFQIERDIVKKQIGMSGELLVWYFANFNLRKTIIAVNDSQYQIESNDGGQKIVISQECFSQLTTIDFANSVEHFKISSHEEILDELLFFNDRRIYLPSPTVHFFKIFR